MPGLGYDREFETYVFHDRYSSIVTVGSFDSKDDPRIAQLQNFFGAKVNEVASDGTPAIGAEAFAVPHPKRRLPNEPVKTLDLRSLSGADRRSALTADPRTPIADC